MRDTTQPRTVCSLLCASTWALGMQTDVREMPALLLLKLSVFSCCPNLAGALRPRLCPSPTWTPRHPEPQAGQTSVRPHSTLDTPPSMVPRMVGPRASLAFPGQSLAGRRRLEEIVSLLLSSTGNVPGNSLVLPTLKLHLRLYQFSLELTRRDLSYSERRWLVDSLGIRLCLCRGHARRMHVGPSVASLPFHAPAFCFVLK